MRDGEMVRVRERERERAMACRGLLVDFLTPAQFGAGSSNYQTEVYGQLWDNYWGSFLRHLDEKVHRRQIIFNSHEIKLVQPTLKDIYICHTGR